MKVLSVRQPWASLITAGLKTIETRSWKPNYRGDFLLCSSQKTDDLSWLPYETRAPILRPATKIEFPRGQALAVVTLTDCRPMTKADEVAAMVPYQEGLWAWQLEDVRPLKPFPVKGQLRLWEYSGRCEDCEMPNLACPVCGEPYYYWAPAKHMFEVEK